MGTPSAPVRVSATRASALRSTSKMPSRAATRESAAKTTDETAPMASRNPVRRRSTTRLCHGWWSAQRADRSVERRILRGMRLEGIAIMRRVRVLLFVVGIGGLAYLVAHVGTEALAVAFGELRWWQFLLVCLPYGLIVTIDTLGWRYAFSRGHVPFHRLLGARLAGDALNVATALASVGGEAVKAWLIRRDVPYEESVPSVVIAKTTITIGQALFLLIGIAVAWTTLSRESVVVRTMLWLLVVEILAVGGFVLCQLVGLVRRGGRLLTGLGVTADASYAERLDDVLRRFYREDRGRLLLSTSFHLGGWLLGGLETYLMLMVLGIPAG